MNLAGLSGYQKPLNVPQLVEQSGTHYIVPANTYWNQMSDRARPSNQVTKVASGSTSSTRHTITRNRPGAMSPGGIGVDIKHNSYNRYLNKIKGKAPLRRGVINSSNLLSPIYGGKIVKTSIINRCACTDVSEQDKLIYNSNDNLQDKILSVRYSFNIGDFVWAKQIDTDTNLYKGEIINIMDELYTVKFSENMIRNIPYCELIIYFELNCTPSLSFLEELLLSNSTNRTNSLTCKDLVLGALSQQ